MSLVHVHIRHHTKTPSGGSGARAVQYLERTHQYAPAVKATVEYLDRRGARVADRDDLRHQEVVHLPAWAAGEAGRFFAAAETYERANGRWATSWQCTLPRELPEEGQVELARAFLETHLPNRPTLWVLHDPVNQQGEHQPHIHVLFSERLDDGIARDEAQTFKRYNAAHPEQGGARKEVFGQGDRHAPYRLREAWCASVNVYLAQEGIEGAWLDPRSLKTRGVERAPVRYVHDAQDTEKLEAHLIDERTPETRAQEAALAAVWWTEYQRTMGLTAAHLRDPHTALALIAREVREPGARAKELAIPFASIAAVDDGWYQVAMGMEAPHLQEAHEGIEAQEQIQEVQVKKAVSVGLDQPLIGNIRSKIYHTAGDPNYGDVRPQNQVLFWSAYEAHEAGYRAAVNQHYGRGTQTRMEVDVAALAERIACLEQYANDVAQARQGQHVPPSKLIALLAGSELEESTGKGLTMKLYQKERDESYGR